MAADAPTPQAAVSRPGGVIPTRFLVGHALATIVIALLVTALPRGAHSRIGIGASLFAGVLIAASAFWLVGGRGAPAPTRRRGAPYLFLSAGLFILAGARWVADETLGVMLAGGGLVCCLAALVLFARGLMRRGAGPDHADSGTV